MKRKLYGLLLSAALILLLAVPAFAVNTNRLVDDANLLTVVEEEELRAKLDEVSQAHAVDVVIVTANSLGDKTATEYADDYYDYNGYGVGDNRDGILLLVSMESRTWAISTCGSCIPAFTDAGQRYMVEQFRPDLSEGEYASAFATFAALCDDFLTQAETGEPYDVNNEPSEPIKALSFPRLALALVGGYGLVIIAAFIKKSKLKTVRTKTEAEDYTAKDGLKLRVQKDIFLRTDVHRTRRESESERGGSSTHKSSSGTTHGGSSGGF